MTDVGSWPAVYGADEPTPPIGPTDDHLTALRLLGAIARDTTRLAALADLTDLLPSIREAYDVLADVQARVHDGTL